MSLIFNNNKIKKNNNGLNNKHNVFLNKDKDSFGNNSKFKYDSNYYNNYNNNDYKDFLTINHKSKSKLLKQKGWVSDFNAVKNGILHQKNLIFENSFFLNNQKFLRFFSLFDKKKRIVSIKKWLNLDKYKLIQIFLYFRNKIVFFKDLIFFGYFYVDKSLNKFWYFFWVKLFSFLRLIFFCPLNIKYFLKKYFGILNILLFFFHKELPFFYKPLPDYQFKNHFISYKRKFSFLNRKSHSYYSFFSLPIRDILKFLKVSPIFLKKYRKDSVIYERFLSKIAKNKSALKMFIALNKFLNIKNYYDDYIYNNYTQSERYNLLPFHNYTVDYVNKYFTKGSLKMINYVLTGYMQILSQSLTDSDTKKIQWSFLNDHCIFNWFFVRLLIQPLFTILSKSYNSWKTKTIIAQYNKKALLAQYLKKASSSISKISQKNFPLKKNFFIPKTVKNNFIFSTQSFLTKKKLTLNRAFLFIKKSFSNIFITLTDLNKKVIVCKTSGNSGIVGNKRRKIAPQAIEYIVSSLLKYLKLHLIKEIYVFFKTRMGKFLHVLIRELNLYNINVISYILVLKKAHNGVKARKSPRK